MTLSCNQAFGQGHIYHHRGSTSSNLRAGRNDSSSGLAHSICINFLVGLLPAASPLNNCRAGWIGASGGNKNTGDTLSRCVKVSLWLLMESGEAQSSRPGGKVSHSTEVPINVDFLSEVVCAQFNHFHCSAIKKIKAH